MYNFIRKDRQTHGGGLIVYVKSNLSFSRRIDLETENLETIWFEVKNSKQKSMPVTVTGYIQARQTGLTK